MQFVSHLIIWLLGAVSPVLGRSSCGNRPQPHEGRIHQCIPCPGQDQVEVALEPPSSGFWASRQQQPTPLMPLQTVGSRPGPPPTAGPGSARGKGFHKHRQFHAAVRRVPGERERGVPGSGLVLTVLAVKAAELGSQQKQRRWGARHASLHSLPLPHLFADWTYWGERGLAARENHRAPELPGWWPSA